VAVAIRPFEGTLNRILTSVELYDKYEYSLTTSQMNKSIVLGLMAVGAVVSTALPAKAGIVISDNYGNCMYYCEMIHVDTALQMKYQYIDMKWNAKQWIKNNPTNIMVVAQHKGQITYPQLFGHAYTQAAKLYEIQAAQNLAKQGK
jgi:hypothetical protein